MVPNAGHGLEHGAVSSTAGCGLGAATLATRRAGGRERY